MSRDSDAAVIREVTAVINAAIERNRRDERTVIVLLVVLFVVGLSVLLYATFVREWALIISGSVIQITVVLPIRKLIKLREENMRLQILPQLLRLANTKESKLLAAKLVAKMIEGIGT